MPKGKPWTREDEKALREMVEQGASIEAIAEAFDREPDAIRMKVKRLDLKVVVQRNGSYRTTTSGLLPSDILTHEQALRILAGAIEKASEPGLDKVEIMRLKVLVDAAKTYDSVLEKFEKWVEIENRLLELDKKIQELQKAQKVQS